MSEVMLNRLVLLWDSLASSAQADRVATSEDRRSFGTRARAEGLPYLTDGLAAMGRCLLDGIRIGYVSKEGFSAARLGPEVDSTLPKFLYSAWSKIFTDDGLGIGASFETDNNGTRVLTSWKPSIEAEVAVRHLRQLTVVFSKLQVPHDKSRVMSTLERFRANEEKLAQMKGILWRTQYANEIHLPHAGYGRQRLTDVLLNARRLLHRLLWNVDPRDIVPRHGSGASACRTRPWERYDRILFDPELNAIWPYVTFASAGISHTEQILSAPFITDGYPKRARGVLVPKDYRGPRFISCEPATSTYHQQGLMTMLVEFLESHHQTRGFVNFTNQCINQDLARQGSVDRLTATLDLKDASDLLSWDLIILLWPEHWFRALRAVRSKVTEIDDPEKGTIRVPLRKHAPMGSSVCFPVMAFTIWCLIKAANFSARPRVWIYGDDIIVASRDATSVCDLLESVGLAVNRQKSFTGPTPFRESCGKEYWAGHDVTPIYCRYNTDSNDETVSSLCAFSNNMVKARGSVACYDIVKLVQQMTGAPVMGIPDNTKHYFDLGTDAGTLPNGGLHFGLQQDYDAGAKPRPLLLYGPMCLCMREKTKRRWNKNLQRFEYRIRVPRPVDVEVEPVTWGYVLRSLLIGGDLGSTNRAALARRISYKYSWVLLDW